MVRGRGLEPDARKPPAWRGSWAADRTWGRSARSCAGATQPATALIGGRNLGAAGDPAVTFTLAIDGRDLERWDVAPDPGFFVHRVALPAGALTGDGRWAELTLRSTAVSGQQPVATAVEQFDVQSPGTLMWAFGTGFHEPELDSVQARSWRWMSERAELDVVQPAGDVTLVLRGESPLKYFEQPSTLEVRCGDVSLGRLDLSGDFDERLVVPDACLHAGDGKVVLTTSQTFSPSDRSGANDRRRLGLRLFEVSLVPGVQTRRRSADNTHKHVRSSLTGRATCG